MERAQTYDGVRRANPLRSECKINGPLLFRLGTRRVFLPTGCACSLRFAFALVARFERANWNAMRCRGSDRGMRFDETNVASTVPLRNDARVYHGVGRIGGMVCGTVMVEAEFLRWVR